MSDNFSYSIRKKMGSIILDLSGKIIGCQTAILKEEFLRLKKSGESKVILNFQDVTSIDSVGVMAIIFALDERLSLAIIHVNTICRLSLEQNPTTRTIPVYASEEEAIRSLISSDISFKEMRRYDRVNTNIPVEILVKQNKHRGVILNISEGGALIGYLDPITPEPYTIKQLYITMELPLVGLKALEGKPVRFGRTSDMYIIGIEFPPNEGNQDMVKRVPPYPQIPPNLAF